MHTNLSNTATQYGRRAKARALASSFRKSSDCAAESGWTPSLVTRTLSWVTGLEFRFGEKDIAPKLRAGCSASVLGIFNYTAFMQVISRTILHQDASCRSLV